MHKLSNNSLSKQAVFGSFDGMTSALGVIAAAYVAGSVHLLVVAALGLAVAAGVAMAGGEFLSDSKSSVLAAAVMGLSTFAGAFIPALPFLLLSKRPALWAGIGLVLITSTGIAFWRHRQLTKSLSLTLLQTYAILFLAGGLSIGATLLFGLF